MSEMYAIKDTTLTALGDAVRNKVIGTSELPIITVENQYINYNQSYPFQLPDFVKKTKIIGSVAYGIQAITLYGLQGLGVSAGVYGKYDYDDVREAENYIVINEGLPFNKDGYEGACSDYNFTFEIVIEGNVGAFVNTQFTSSPTLFRLTYTAVGLDENGNEFKYTPLEMVDKINSLVIPVIPEEALNITGSCMYKFSFDGWNWFIENYGDKITTSEISNASYMFNESGDLTKVPFDINLSQSATTLENMFHNCSMLADIPNVSWTQMPTSTVIVKSLLYSCELIKTIPEWVIELCEHNHNTAVSTGKWNDFGPFNNMFKNCTNIRKIPERLMSVMWNPVATGYYYTLIYSKPFSSMECLDELVNQYYEDVELTSNQFSNAFSLLYHINRFTMATNEDGTPFTRKWKNQTVDLTVSVGHGYLKELGFDKKVENDAEYQALKNDADWWSDDVNYSRYNHDSAVETINSLPDTSAYGTNTIKFKGAAGALTDGGAINTLTEEEIAVAAAKGWTVSFV